MKKIKIPFFIVLFCLCLRFLMYSAFSQEVETLSPDKKIAIHFKLDEEGRPQYSISAFNDNFLLWSNLELDLKEGGSLNKNFKISDVSAISIDDNYKIIAG